MEWNAMMQGEPENESLSTPRRWDLRRQLKGIV